MLTTASHTRGFNVHVRHPHAYTPFEQTVFPGNHTGVARHDTATLGACLTHPDLTTALIAMLHTQRPCDGLRSWRSSHTNGFWSIFALLSADDPHPSNPGAVSWIRRNIIAAVAGALADAHSADHPPPSPHIDDALRDSLVRLDDTRTGQPWARNAGRASALLAFFDSESRMLRVANTGPCRAFLGRRVSGANYECMELIGPGSPRYLELEPARTRWMDAEELVNEGVIPSPVPLHASSVETRRVEVRDEDYLVLGSESAWPGLEGRVAVQAVSA
jgi:hypothetical protein